jgi:hypothetical protein
MHIVSLTCCAVQNLRTFKRVTKKGKEIKIIHFWKAPLIVVSTPMRMITFHVLMFYTLSLKRHAFSPVLIQMLLLHSDNRTVWYPVPPWYTPYNYRILRYCNILINQFIPLSLLITIHLVSLTCGAIRNLRTFLKGWRKTVRKLK